MTDHRLGTRETYQQRRGALDWQEQAACTPDMAASYTPESKLTDTEINRLVAVCNQCPVITQCARLGVDVGTPGVWAGVYVPQCGRNVTRARQQLRRKAGIR